MKYAHLADAHLGAWRDPKMRDLAIEAWLKTINDCVEKEVDFIIFSGDLFNTSLPSIDILKIVTKRLRELKKEKIPFYTIAGSHDFSPSGKTMLEVLENAGLLINVCRGEVNPETKKLHLRFTIDPKTGTKLTGLLGKKGMLDRIYYENLDLPSLEQEGGYKIFLFHITLDELKPKHLEKIESQPLSFLPKNFNYYAGGHIHHPTKVEQPGYEVLTYPGALFPANFGELERYSQGGYYIVEFNGEQKVEWVPLKIKEHTAIKFDCSHQSPEVATFEILNQLNQQDLTSHLVTVRLFGKLSNGKISDINFKQIFEQFYKQGAYFVMKNTSQLQSEDFEEIKINTDSPENIEEQIIKEHLQQIELFDQEKEFSLTKDILQLMNTEKQEGETVRDFQQRIKEELTGVLELKGEIED